MPDFRWSRHGGYEVSTRGDPRFSAFNARLPDGRSIEEHYQGDIKGYDPGGTNWRLGKGRPPLDPTVDLYPEYLGLWRQWSDNNLPLMRELWHRGRQADYTLSDRFATTPVNQARALSELLNELVKRGRA
jgi:hypothetical protein